ncbi:hypothetical protein [Anabaena sp. AL93]|jgi:hypothetical protein|uniref:hypothetical protein n=1 Tax=Anabaena sp. AL93 TaxID=1678133 RepID=UPI0007FD0379|nr:hypothetical protein [Anabaena sp. AL93]OBQ17422.1 MAG: hypothetical protein AN486_15355 [Anabaena sp. AL93]
MKLLKTLFSVAAMSVMSISSLNVLMPSTAEAQVPDGRYEIQPNNQIFFYPADKRQNPIVVYKGKGKATHIINYGGAIYTAFEKGSIYRSPDGQNLGGGGSTTKAYALSATVNKMLVCQNALFTAFKGGYIYRSPDGLNLGGGGNTASAYRGTGEVQRMTCTNRNSVITYFVGGQVYESPDGLNLGGGGNTQKLN